MKTYLLVVVLWFSFIFRVQSQVVTILDKTTLKPLPGVNIAIKHPELTLLTDINGQATINQQPDSLYLSYIGYQPVRLSYATLAEQQFHIVLSESSFSLGEVVIAATRFAEKKEDIPQQIQILKSKELQFINQPTTADVLQQTGNILVQKSQLGGGSPIIRGFEANKVLLVVDGVRMNNAIYRGGHLQNSLTLDNSMLDRVEVVYGPGSVVYGSDALGGVMHFYARKPELSMAGKTNVKTNAFLRYSTAAQEKTGHVDVNIGVNKIASLTSFTYSDFSDLKQGQNTLGDYGDWGKRLFYVQRQNGQDIALTNPDPYLQKQSGYKQYDVLQKILFSPSERVEHILNFQFSTSSNIPRYDRLTLVSNQNPRFAEWYYGPQERIMGSYALNLNGGTAFYDKASVVVALQHISESRHDRGFQKTVRNNRLEQVQVFTVNADLEKKIKNNDIRFGFENAYNRVNSTAFGLNINTGEKLPLDTRYPLGGSTMQSTAVYVTHTYSIHPKLKLSDGIRFNQINLKADFGESGFFPFPFRDVKQNNQALNGNLGLTWHPAASWRFSVLGSTGFRAPNVDDLSKVFESVPGNIIVPNPNLKPEHTYNGEVSITKSIKRLIQLEWIGYYTNYQNAITTRSSTYQGQDSIMYNGLLSRVTSNQNAARAYIYGSNFQLSANITPSLSVNSSLNFTYGRIRTDSTDYPLDHIPPLFGKTSLHLKVKRFNSELFVMYNGWKRTKDYNMLGEDNFSYATLQGMPAWYTLNLRTTYQLSKNLQIMATLENITDVRYRVFASNIHSAGRNFILTVRGSF